MAYDTEKRKVGRQPVKLVEIDADLCTLTYGTAPCTASGAAGSECYNTRATCQDPANYDPGTTTYKFCETNAPGEVVRAGYIPAVKSVATKPTRIDPAKGVALRESRTVQILDFSHHDRGVDPYVATRSYDPLAQGTYWGRWLARNRYYTGRALRVIDAYVADTGLDLVNDTKTHHYVIDRIDGPDRGGVKITAKDVLKLADDKRAQCPAKSTGALAADITSTDTSLAVTAGTGSEYATYRGAAVSASNPGYVRISDEIIAYTGVSTDTLTGLDRAEWGTTADDHAAGDDVQLCWHVSAENMVDIIEELLTDFAGIDAAYIPSVDWAAEKSTWFSSSNATAIVSEPTGVTTLINELCRDFQANLWWSDEAQEIKLKSIIPDNLNTTTVDYTDDDHLVRDRITVKRDPSKRISRMVIWYGPRDWAEDLDRKNMRYGYAEAKLTEESAELYGEQRIEVIESRWIATQSIAGQTAARALNRLKDDPILIEMVLDAKDDALQVGGSFTVLTRHIQGADGAPVPTKFQVLTREEVQGGHQIKYTAQNLAFSGRYGFVMADTANDYGSATDDELATGCYIAPTAAGFSDGGLPYKIL